MLTARYLQTTFQRLFIIIKKKGIGYVLIISFNFMFSFILELYYSNFNKKFFLFQNEYYPYFYHRYNLTWLNERCIEISIFRKILLTNLKNNLRTLEVGNVLSNYFEVIHDIVDKYDKNNFVIKEDIIDFKSKKKYDLIFCISTLEHVGWDEIPKQPEKILIAFARLKELLSENGVMYISLPIGENDFLDKCLRNGKIKFDKQFNFKRISKRKWEETEWEKIKNAKKDVPFRFSNAFIIGKTVSENKNQK